MMEWTELADQLEKREREEEALHRDEHDVQCAIERLIAAGRLDFVSQLCEDTLKAISRVIT